MGKTEISIKNIIDYYETMTVGGLSGLTVDDFYFIWNKGLYQKLSNKQVADAIGALMVIQERPGKINYLVSYIEGRPHFFTSRTGIGKGGINHGEIEDNKHPFNKGSKEQYQELLGYIIGITNKSIKKDIQEKSVNETGNKKFFSYEEFITYLGEEVSNYAIYSGGLEESELHQLILNKIGKDLYKETVEQSIEDFRESILTDYQEFVYENPPREYKNMHVLGLMKDLKGKLSEITR